ncbi:tRNA pseudouridine(55) synthase TruB [Legionella gresilensis]|uniref:tRNA pseudouridine(55) synthase TruB n=1 Tax=Legionella gresilensis TaxID=91823 RepID=UPI0010419E30|nr:tRNA pseudouridine(55) synthase TruB [Legionella gresilensis]
MSLNETKKPINGILLLNKPQGITSNVALQKAKRLFKAMKAGHTGSLDPLATGMLPICFGEATKFSQYLLTDSKVYIATGLLGAKTDTGDADGATIAAVDKYDVQKQRLEEVINQFVGATLQTPSMYSALKFKGQPLYKFARAGITIEREARPINIYSIELLAFDGQYFTIKVHCGKGTYIRNLVEDIGENLGVYAHLTQLHRVYIDHFKDKPMYELSDLTCLDSESLATCLIPCEYAVNHLPIVTIDDCQEIHLRQGKIVTALNNDLAYGCVRLHNQQGQFIGLGELSDSRVLKVKRLLAKNVNSLR